MSLELRDLSFDLEADDLPFLWNPANPAFALQMDAISMIAISFEKFIVSAVDEAMPRIKDPEVRAEAQSFLDQEAIHAGWHREHVRTLTRRYPGLVNTMAEAIAVFDRMTETRSLAYRLAFVADLEATFTPWFKMLLDHDRELFGDGDDRVASLFLWHFTEEVEHRSHGLLIYDAVVPVKWYRTLVLPSVLKQINTLVRVITEGFNAAVPVEVRKIDARVLLPSVSVLDAVRKTPLGRVPAVRRRLAWVPEVPDCYAGVPGPARRTALWGVLLSQLPYHDPGDQPLPEFTTRWFERYEAGGDVAHWYQGAPAARS